jgi:apolipoprotein N-acyltransferase
MCSYPSRVSWQPRGAQLIGVPSKDWGEITDKHDTHVVFRAVENRVAMVKADGGYDLPL